MALSSLDFISPKITLYYNGRNSHISLLGGFLSLCLLALILSVILYTLWDAFINPQVISSFSYEQNTTKKISQSISYSGINHFIQLFSHTDNGWFGDLDNKNLIIYSIKENQTSSFKNLEINLSNTEHWLYDKCEKIFEINKNLFSDISNNIPNYKKSICLRFYYNSKTKEYYEIGFDGYVPPNLETNEIFEKKSIYKIIIEKCINNTFINKRMGYICNNENEINNYLQIYSDIFIYFIDNQIIPVNYKLPFEKYFYSISSPLNTNSSFQNNIIFSPIKLITDNHIISNNNEEEFSIVLNRHYSFNNINSKKNLKIIGVYNFYLDNNVIIYYRKYLNCLEIIAFLGGIAKILFFIFQILNYFNWRYTALEHTRELFQICTGVDYNINNNFEGKEFFFEKRHMTNHNYKIKVFNNNNIINAEDINKSMTKSYYGRVDNKKKFKLFDKKASVKKNFLPLTRNKDTFLSKRSQTKYINNLNEIPMGKQIAIRNKEKRKSFLSQGFFIGKSRNSLLSKNQSMYENDLSNNEIIINNDRTNVLFFKDGTLKNDSPHRISHEANNIKPKKDKKNIKSKKINPKKSFIESNENIANLLVKNLESNNGRHKSVNITNERKLFDYNNSLNNRYGLGKNSSGFINDSSKGFLLNNKAPFMLFNNKIQLESKYDKYSRIPSRIPTIINNNNDIFNNNITGVLNNNTGGDPSNYLKSLVHNMIKFHIPEAKKNNNYVENYGKKIKYFDFLKSLFIFSGKNENKLWLLESFRIKLLSEEHIYRVFINLYLIERIFQIDAALRFELNEMYNNL